MSDCFVHNGDDCLTVKGGCEDVLIADSYFASGHGASVGSVTDVGAELHVAFAKFCEGRAQDFPWQTLRRREECHLQEHSAQRSAHIPPVCSIQ